LALKGRGNRKDLKFNNVPLGDLIMPYQCQCGNNERFYEAFDVAIDVVDGEGRYLEMKDRNVMFYTCSQCDREISYEEFWSGVAAGAPQAT
jgi:hypothetical protein